MISSHCDCIINCSFFNIICDLSSFIYMIYFNVFSGFKIFLYFAAFKFNIYITCWLRLNTIN